MACKEENCSQTTRSFHQEGATFNILYIQGKILQKINIK